VAVGGFSREARLGAPEEEGEEDEVFAAAFVELDVLDELQAAKARAAPATRDTAPSRRRRPAVSSDRGALGRVDIGVLLLSEGGS
jgi:hypothetical protein